MSVTSPAPSIHSDEPSPGVKTALPTRDILLGLSGYVALPLVGLLGSPDADALSAAIAPPIAALFLSVPSLIVGHQYLSLSASPRDLMSDIGRVFVQTGKLALGLVPTVGLYAATTGLGPLTLVLSLTSIGVLSIELARRRIIRREQRATALRTEISAPKQRQMVLLATAWAGLSLLIAVRMGLSFAQTV